MVIGKIDLRSGPNRRLRFVSGLAACCMALSPAGFAQGLKITELSPAGAASAAAIGVNKNNQVVGNYTTSTGAVKGFRHAGTKYTTIVFPKSVNFTRANGINDSGEIVGDFFGSDNAYHGFTLISGVYTQYDLPGGKGNFSTSIFGVNSLGDTAGAAGGGTLGPGNEGWVNIAGTVTTFFGSGTDNTLTFGINTAHEFVGQYFDSSGFSHGFSGTISGGAPVITEIAYPGAVQTSCEGINDSGEITGWYIDATGVGHGFTDIGGVFATSDLPFIGGVNSAGSYVGSYTDPVGIERGYLASPVSFKPANVSIHNSMSTSIFGVNNAGTMVGYYVNSKNVSHGMMLSGTTVTNVDDPNGLGNTFCYGINTNNEIVGYYVPASDPSTTIGFYYSAGTFTDIPGPAGSTVSVAYGINDSGQIAGNFFDAQGQSHGFLLSGVGGTYTQLDGPSGINSYAWGVNAAGAVTVGYQVSATNTNIEAVLYNGSTYTPMNLPGVASLNVHGINKNGDIVYSWYDGNGNVHGGLFSSGSFYLLDEPAGSSTRADGINDSGLIVGRYLPAGSTQFKGFKGQK